MDGKKITEIVIENHTVCQCENNHIHINDADGNMVFHSACNEKKTEKDLITTFNFFKKMREMVNDL